MVKPNLILLFTIILATSFSQKNDIADFDETNPSFRIKTEIVSLIGLHPNIYSEYKINKRLGFSLGYLYNLNGLIWTAPYIRENKSEGLYEWWLLKGSSLDFGIKYYSEQTKYYSFRINFDELSCNNEKLETGESVEAKYGSIRRNDLHLRLIKGFEKKYHSSYFHEIYFGIGLLIIEETYDYGFYESGYLAVINYKKATYLHVVPTFHIGFNTGLMFTRTR